MDQIKHYTYFTLPYILEILSKLEYFLNGS